MKSAQRSSPHNFGRLAFSPKSVIKNLIAEDAFMRSGRKSLLALLSSAGITLSLLSPRVAIAGSQTPSAQKDPAALAALAQMVAATGWNPLSLPADAVVTGVVTPVATSTSTVTLKMKGLGEFRVDTQTVAGVRSLILNIGQAALTLPDGTSQLLQIQDAVSIWPVHLPVFSSLALP